MTEQNWDEYPIQPWDIRTRQYFRGAFGKYESEFAARVIVNYCKLREGWVQFSIMDLHRSFPVEVKNDRFDLSSLVENEFLLIGSDGRYSVTSIFIDRCYQAGNRPTHS